MSTQAEHRIDLLNSQAEASLRSIAGAAAQLQPLLAQRAQRWADAAGAFGAYSSQALALDRAVGRYYEAHFGVQAGAGEGDENADPQVGEG